MAMAKLTAAAVTLSLLCGCSVRRSLDEQAVQEIASDCGLVGAKLIVEGGRKQLWLDGAANTNDRTECASRQIEKRGYGGGIYVDLNHLPPPTPKQRKCLDDLAAKKGEMWAADHGELCGVKA